MNELDSSDHQQTRETLPLWATMKQVSDVLGVSRRAIRAVVRKAAQNQEPWVKKTTSEESKWPTYLIQTDHPMYQSQREHWKQRSALDASSQTHEGPRPTASTLNSLFCTTGEPPYCTSESKAQPFMYKPGLLDAYPQLRRWLCSLGLQIFTNSLEEPRDTPWHWHWGNLHGEWYGTQEKALIAALAHRLGTLPQHREESAQQTDASHRPGCHEDETCSWILRTGNEKQEQEKGSWLQ